MFILAIVTAACTQAQPPQAVPLVARQLVDCGTPIKDMTLDPGGKRLFTVTIDCVLTAWNSSDGRRIWNKKVIKLAALAWGGKWLLGGLDVPCVATIDPKTGEHPLAIGGPEISSPSSAFVGDSRGLFAWFGIEKGLVRLIPGSLTDGASISLDNGGVTALALDAADELLAIGGRDGSVRLTKSQGDVDQKRVLLGHTGAITALAFGPKVIVSAAADRTVRIWSLTSRKEKITLSGTGAEVGSLAVAGKQGWIATGDANGMVVMWDLGKGTELARLQLDNDKAVAKLAFHKKEKALLAASGARVVAIDLSDFKASGTRAER